MENSFQRDPWASIYHRILGKCILYTDIDSLQTEEGSMDNINLEYLNNYGKNKRVAIFDYKRQNAGKQQSVGMQYSAMQTQLELANDLNIPLFMVLTYLSEEYEHKMYYVIPINDIAKDFFKKRKIDCCGMWQTLKTHSQFQHALRDIKWNQNERIPFKIRWNETLKLSDREEYLLKELPNKVVKYPLPKMTLEIK